MKTAFITSLIRLMDKYPDAITITADMGFDVFEDLQKRYPNRFFNTGVTEQASISFAAGMALSGYKVFFYAQAAFATMRCFEQVRLDVAYNNVNVKIIGTNAGVSLNQLGVSHFAIEDIGLMRLLPNMKIFSPGDPSEMEWSMDQAYKINGPAYVRFTKAGGTPIYSRKMKFKIGKAVNIKTGTDGAFFATGGLLSMAIRIVENLREKGINLSLYSVPTIKPIDGATIIKEAKKKKHIFTLEEHYISGGLGSAVAEVLAEEKVATELLRFGFPDKFTSVTGSINYLLARNGISIEKIEKTIENKFKKL